MTTLPGLILDAGALIAVERGDRRVRLLLDETERAGWRAWYQSARWLRCGAMALGRPHSPGSSTPRTGLTSSNGIVATARAAGVLCGRVGTSDVVDASVALCARERDHHVVTSDPQDFAILDPQLSVIVI
ncbi:MAG: hypothetical protein ACRDQY_22665 [Pseudonocardiaceae bacterium]